MGLFVRFLHFGPVVALTLLFALGDAMSSPKAEARSMIEGLPEDASLEDIQYHLYVLEKVKRGIERAETEGTIKLSRLPKQFPSSRN